MSTHKIENVVESYSSPVGYSTRSSANIFHQVQLVDGQLETKCYTDISSLRVSEREILEKRGTYRRCARCWPERSPSLIGNSVDGDDANYNCPNCGRPTLKDNTSENVDLECQVCGEKIQEVDA